MMLVYDAISDNIGYTAPGWGLMLTETPCYVYANGGIKTHWVQTAIDIDWANLTILEPTVNSLDI